jgi:hypothetical protein
MGLGMFQLHLFMQVFGSIVRIEPRTPCQPPQMSLVHTIMLGPNG